MGIRGGIGEGGFVRRLVRGDGGLLPRESVWRSRSSRGRRMLYYTDTAPRRKVIPACELAVLLSRYEGSRRVTQRRFLGAIPAGESQHLAYR